MTSHFNPQTNPLTTGASVSVLDYVHASGAALKQLIDEQLTKHTTVVRTRIVPKLETAGITFTEKGNPQSVINNWTRGDQWIDGYTIPANKKMMLVEFVLPGFIHAADRLSRIQADTWTGYWVHEALHVVYSDLDVIKQHEAEAKREFFGAFSNPAARHQAFVLYEGLYNALEDVRIEYLAQRKCMVKNLSACLSRLRNFSYAKSVDERPPGVPENMLDIPENAAYTMKIVLNVQLLGFDLPRVARDWKAATRMPSVLNGYLSDMLATPTTTQQEVHTASVQIARDLIQLALDSAPQQSMPVKAPPKNEAGDGTGEPQPGSGDDSEEDSEDEDDSSSGVPGEGEPSEDEDEGDEEAEPGAGESEGDEEPGENDGSGQGDDQAPGDAFGEPEASEDTGDGDGTGDLENSDQEAFAALLTAVIKAAVDSLEGLLKGDPDHQDNDIEADEILLNATEPMRTWGGGSAYTRTDDARSLLPKTAAFENDLRYLVRAPDRSGVTGHKHRGRLQSRAIPRGIAGASDIFQRRWVEEGHNTAVLVIVDHSGSMSDPTNMNKASRQRVANALTYVIGDTLARAGSPFAATVFDDNTTILKNFTDPWNQTVQRRIMSVSPTGGTGADTAFAQSVQLFRQLRPSQRVTRRIILFVVDGDNNNGPEVMRQLVPSVKQIARLDGVYALGIERDVDWGLDGAEKVDGKTIGQVGLATIKQALLSRK